MSGVTESWLNEEPYTFTLGYRDELIIFPQSIGNPYLLGS